MATTQSEKKLGKFEGQNVLTTSIAIRNAGDGLSKAMAVDPEKLTLGQRLFVIIETEVVDVHHKPVVNTNGLERVHVCRAVSATTTDEDLVRDQLDEQAERIQLAREEEEGVQRLPKDGEVSDEGS